MMSKTDDFDDDDFGFDDDFDDDDDDDGDEFVNNETTKPHASSSSSSSFPSSPSPSLHDNALKARQNLVFCANKAGMSSSSAQRTNTIVYEMSKDSSYFKKAERSGSATTKRIAKMKRRIAELHSTRRLGTEEQLHAQQLAYLDGLVTNAGGGGKKTSACTFVVVDLDQFYAAVEIRERPELAGKPIAVGGMSMISTSSYEARKFGVRSAMPGFIAMRLCPSLILVRSHFHLYEDVGRACRAIFADYDPDYRSMSLDEASLDVTEYMRLHGITDGAVVAEDIRRRIFESQRITASAGIANSRVLAKIASNMRKPNGQFKLAADRATVLSFLDTLPLRDYPGIGKVSERVLSEACGLKFVGEMRQPRHAYVIRHVFSTTTARYLLKASLGLSDFARAHDGDDNDDAEADADDGNSNHVDRKSCSRERTFRRIDELRPLQEKLREVVAKLGDDMARRGLEARHITLKLKTVEFDIHSCSKSLDSYVHTANDIDRHAQPLLQSEFERLAREHQHKRPRIAFRLMGVRLASLRSTNATTTLTKSLAARFFRVDEAQVAVTSTPPADNSPATASAAATGTATIIPSPSLPLPSTSKRRKPATFASLSQQFNQLAKRQTATVAAATLYECPVCGQVVDGGVNALNVHLDACAVTATTAPPPLPAAATVSSSAAAAARRRSAKKMKRKRDEIANFFNVPTTTTTI